MTTYLSLAAGAIATGFAVASLVRKRRSVATWCFAGGMLALAVDSVFTGLSAGASGAAVAAEWLALGFVAKSLVPVFWLGFSLTFSRGDRDRLLRRWRIALAVVGTLPVVIAVTVADHLVEFAPEASTTDGVWLHFGTEARALNVVVLGCLVAVLANLESTFRAAVGTIRWRVKYVILGIASILGTHIYVRSQAILFSTYDIALSSVEPAGLIVGCLFFALGYARAGWAEIDIYPSREVIRSSVTVIIVGSYLLSVGLLAQVPKLAGSGDSLRLRSLIVLFGVSGLGLLLLSDRFRREVQGFVGRHFRRAEHDAAAIWTRLSQRLASVPDDAAACVISAQLVSETFAVLSVRIWLVDPDTDVLRLRASTAEGAAPPYEAERNEVTQALLLPGHGTTPFELELAEGAWASELRRLNRSAFQTGGTRWAVPLRSGERTIGVMVLADRVRGIRFSTEEISLLASISGHLTSVLLNLRLGQELVRSRELEAFRTMSTFFVHDLKNAAASLQLMLANAAKHFDDPDFRQDAIRGIGNVAKRIEDTIARLAALRERPDAVRVKADLNELVNEALDGATSVTRADIVRRLTPVPRIMADRDQLRGVVTNLVQNAQEAISSGGRIEVRTERRGDAAVLSVEDTGCGMSQAYIRESLFRPFQSTKKKGLGIGLFQARAIVHAHGGNLQVQSELGKGTTFTATFPGD